MPVHNCPNCSYTSHRPFDLRRHLRRKIPCNLIGGNLNTSVVDKIDEINLRLIKQNNGLNEQNTIPNKQNVALNEDKGANKCDKCKKTFSNHSNYISHVRKKKCRGCEPEVCKICLKRFNSTTARATHNRRVNCKPPSIQTPNIDTTNCIPDSSSNPNEFIYLIQLREFVRNNEPVYKIGRTKQSYEKRIRSYPRGSSLFFYHAVDDCVTTETNIKQYLSEKFTQRRDLGLEYFEGDCKLIMKSIKQLL